MLSRYGEALFSIPVNLDFGCPNRDHEGQGGCTFCPEHGARAAQIADATSVEEQIQKALMFAKRRYKAKRFALYIQAYTGTFSSLRTQKQTYKRLLRTYAFDALYIGTRPDCLSDATLEYLSEVNQTCDVVVELGVQSMHDESLVRMNRGHDVTCTRDAIKRLHEKGLRVHAHLILGLQGETPLQWKQSVQKLVELSIDGIKFHNLHIIKNTELAHQYQEAPFPLLGEYAYAEVLIDLLRFIPSTIPIIRLSTDTPQKELIAPKWQMEKGHFSEYIIKTMRYRGIEQGDFVEKACKKSDDIHKSILLKDGSTTFWSKMYRDYYHPKAGAYAQAQTLFIEKSHLKNRLEKADVKLLEIGFGMGYNCFEAVKVAQKIAQHRLHVKAVDHDRMVLEQSTRVLREDLHVKMVDALFTCKSYENDFATLEFINAEARYAITFLDELFDVIFLDPFVENNNASLVSLEFLKRLRMLLKPKGVLVASTSFQAVQSGLSLAGFEVSLFHNKTSDIKGVIATPTHTPTILHIINPYRDPHLILSDKEIESTHQKGTKSTLANTKISRRKNASINW